MALGEAQEDWVEQRVAWVRWKLGLPPAPPAAAPPPETEQPAPKGEALAPYLDHTLLKPDATPEQVLALAGEARQHGFAGVCANPWHTRRVADALLGSSVRPIAVVGFPLGATFPKVKAAEAALAVENGAAEIDVVLNLGAIKAELLEEALADLKTVVVGARHAPVKVILETHLLTPEEKVLGCVLAELAGAKFVKTSTGFGGGGATVEDVRLLRRAMGDRLWVKASGGIRTAAFAGELVRAGARRLGSSSSVALIQGKGARAQAAY